MPQRTVLCLLSIRELESISQQLKQSYVRIDHLEDAVTYLSTTGCYHGARQVINIDTPNLAPTVYKRMIIEELPTGTKSNDIQYYVILTHLNETLAKNLSNIFFSKKSKLNSRNVRDDM